MTPPVPTLPAGVSVAVAAQAYAADGWYVLSVTPLTKHAGSVLGTGSPERSTRVPADPCPGRRAAGAGTDSETWMGRSLSVGAGRVARWGAPSVPA